METDLKVTINQTKEMVMGVTYIHMVGVTKETTKMIKDMATGRSLGLMEINTWEPGKMNREMGQA